jgi:RNA polymerase sigma-70 factor (ECF subfamily)
MEEMKLLAAVAEGCESSFRVLYRQYHNKLGAFVFRVTASREISQEIVQDVFLKIWLNRSGLPAIKSFKAYLFTVSKNQALNYLKKSLAERAGLLRLESYYHESNNIDSGMEVEYYRYMLLDEAIRKLPEQQKKVYILSRHKRLKYAQIAIEMDLSVETVKKYLQIATSSIVRHFNEHQHRELTTLALSFFLLFS